MRLTATRCPPIWPINTITTSTAALRRRHAGSGNLLRRHSVIGAFAQPRGRSLDGWSVGAMKPVAEAEEDRRPLIDRGDFFTRKFAEHAPDPPLVNRS